MNKGQRNMLRHFYRACHAFAEAVEIRMRGGETEDQAIENSAREGLAATGAAVPVFVTSRQPIAILRIGEDGEVSELVPVAEPLLQ